MGGPVCLTETYLWVFLSCCRYDELAESVEDYVLDVLRDQLNRRQPMDNVSRNLLRLLTATCGFKEARLMAVQRLEMWLQNPKVSGCSQLALLFLVFFLGSLSVTSSHFPFF